jgi:hypothetical protein
MNRKMVSLFVLASLLLSYAPLAFAATTLTISSTVGPVGTEITASGTVSTFNGRYEIVIYPDVNNPTVPTVVETGTAVGYSYTSDAFKIPNAHAGGRTIQVIDLDTAGAPTSNAIFTVQTKVTLEADPTSNYEGGPVAITATVTGADAAWDGVFDVRIRVKNPGATAEAVQIIEDVPETPIGLYEWTYTWGPNEPFLTDYGTYTAFVDWDNAAGAPTWPSARQGAASTTFIIRLTDNSNYQRTETVKMKTYVPAGKTLSKFQVTDPTGAVSEVSVGPVVGAAWTGEVNVIVSQKDAALGTWTVKLYDSVAGAYYKTATFTMNIAEFTAEITDFSDPGTLQRTLKSSMDFRFEYPNGDYLASADTKAGLSIKVYYNTTLAATVVLDPLLAFDVPSNTWTAEWKVPKDAKLGTKYAMNITVNAVEDVYGNKGPAKYVSTGEEYDFFEVIPAVLTVTTPSLTYPAAGATVSRMPVTPPKATFQVKYPDGSLMTGAELSELNVTVTDGDPLYTLSLAAADYNPAVGLWIATWKVPYNAAVGAGYQFWVLGEDVKDIYGNGKNLATVASSAFGVGVAAITVSDLATDASSYQSDDTVTVTFKATYPNGDAVTKATATVTLYAGGFVASKAATYSAATNIFTASFIVPNANAGGVWNATVYTNNVQDDATPVNQGPSANKYVNFDVDRVSLTDVLAAADAAKASSVLAQTKADAAKTAADAAASKAEAAQTAATGAGTAANAAKSAADAATNAANAAGTKADAAKAAADAAKASSDAAKTAADSAAAAANGLTTLVYAAIGASLIAALAAIVALMQISRKIA